MRSLPIPEDVVELAAEFTAWRSARPHSRSAVPDELLRRAAQAASVHTAGVVARAIKFDKRRLETAFGRRPAEKPAVAQESPVRAAGMRLAQVALTPPVLAPPKTVVEITDPAGWRLSVTGSDAAGLVKAFMEGRR